MPFAMFPARDPQLAEPRVTEGWSQSPGSPAKPQLCPVPTGQPPELSVPGTPGCVTD